MSSFNCFYHDKLVVLYYIFFSESINIYFSNQFYQKNVIINLTPLTKKKMTVCDRIIFNVYKE